MFKVQEPKLSNIFQNIIDIFFRSPTLHNYYNSIFGWFHCAFRMQILLAFLVLRHQIS